MVNFKNKYPMMIFAFPKKAISENLKEYCDSRSGRDFYICLCFINGIHRILSWKIICLCLISQLKGFFNDGCSYIHGK